MADGTAGAKPLTERALKWVVSITAVISMVFAIQKLVQTIADNNDRSRRIDELTQVAERQRNSGDSAMAWESLTEAKKIADAGGSFARMFGTLDADTKKIRVARETVAMYWLDHISVPSGSGFTSVVEKLQPVLEEGVVASTGSRKADLLAHIGWGYFLRGRDGQQRIEPTPQYEQAVALDADNPFAQAYWGHWLLWNGGTFDDANKHFVLGLKSNRERERVRELQLSAYKNRGSDGDVMYLKTVVEMLKQQETVDKGTKKLALWNIARGCPPSASTWLGELKSLMPKAEVESAYRMLVEPPKDKDEVARQENCLTAIQK